MEFWNEEFIPSIEKMNDEVNEEQAKELISALKAAQEKIPEMDIEKGVEILQKRITYINTKLKAIENSKFWNVIVNDIQYYREKERAKILKEKGIRA
jgi:hypothetical protein